MRQSYKGFFLFFLGHTAGHDGQRTFSFNPCACKTAQKTIGLFLGLMANGAGIAQNQICQGRIMGLFIPRTLQKACQNLGIIHIHLASNGLYVGFWLIWAQNKNPFSTLA